MVCCNLWLATEGARTIERAENRTRIVEEARAVIDNEGRAAIQFDAIRSPFIDLRDLEKPEEEQPVAVAPDPETKSEQPRVPMKLPDAVALRSISERFNPLGSMVLGNRGILQLGGGRTIEQGESFNATIQGTEYRVEVEAVTPSDYTLRLGEATIRKRFIDSGQTGR
jgi:hypothetical protein